MKSYLIIIFFLFSAISKAFSVNDWELKDDKYKFSITLSDDWKKTDSKETDDKDAISYSLEKKDKKCSIMILGFKITAVKNLEDFIYTMEKDVSLNIPTRFGDYTTLDHGSFDAKSATYKDQQYIEKISYFRTKLPDAPFNFVYMLRFITTVDNFNSDIEKQIIKITESFLPTAK